MRKEIGRRDFILRRLFPLVAAAELSVACGFPELPGQGMKASEWPKLSPDLRLDLLSRKRYPKIDNFDPTGELLLASAQQYCARTGCSKSPEELARKISLVSFEQLLPALQEESGRQLSESDIAFERESRAELARSNGQILVNRDVLAAIGTFIGTNLSKVANGRQEYFKRYDIGMIVMRGAFLRALIQLNFTHDSYDLSHGITMARIREISGNQLMGVTGFNFVVDRGNNQTIVFDGARSAAVDFVAGLIAKDEKLVYYSPRAASEGAFLLQAIAQAAGVGQDQLSQYTRGILSTKDFITRIGASINPRDPNEALAFIALFTIALRVNGLVSQSDALNTLRGIMNSGQQNSSPKVFN